jgi:hypothetical protein
VDDQTTNGVVYARTSLNGLNWTSPQSLSFLTLDAVNIACQSTNGTCLLTYMLGSATTPRLVNHVLTVGTGGTLTLGASSTASQTVEWTPGVGLRTVNGAAEALVSVPHQSCTRLGVCDIQEARHTGMPFAAFNWNAVNATAVRPTFASLPESNNIYMLYAN